MVNNAKEESAVFTVEGSTMPPSRRRLRCRRRSAAAAASPRLPSSGRRSRSLRPRLPLPSALLLLLSSLSLLLLPTPARAQLGCKLSFNTTDTPNAPDQSFAHGESFGSALPTVCGPNYPCYCANGQANCPLCATETAEGEVVCANDGETVTVVDVDGIEKSCTCDHVFGTDFFWNCRIAGDDDGGAAGEGAVGEGAAPPAPAPVPGPTPAAAEQSPVGAPTGTIAGSPAPAVTDSNGDGETTVGENGCMINMYSEQCPTLMQRTEFMNLAATGIECDCYNFCDSSFIGCCDFGGTCGLQCPGTLVAGCIEEEDEADEVEAEAGADGAAPTAAADADDPVAAPTAAVIDNGVPTVPAVTPSPVGAPIDAVVPAPEPEPQPEPEAAGTCLVTIDAESECPSLVRTVTEDCDCYNFCNGEFNGCCGFGESCPLSCSGTIVGGCTKPRPDEGEGEEDGGGGAGAATSGGSSTTARMRVVFRRGIEAVGAVGFVWMVL